MERAFGVLQIQWSIVKNPGRVWDVDCMKTIMKTCVILHNMNIEYTEIESASNIEIQCDNISVPDLLPEITVSHENVVPVQGTIAWLLGARQQIKNRLEHVALKTDLINHMWEQEGDLQ